LDTIAFVGADEVISIELEVDMDFDASMTVGDGFLNGDSAEALLFTSSTSSISSL